MSEIVFSTLIRELNIVISINKQFKPKVMWYEKDEFKLARYSRY